MTEDESMAIKVGINGAAGRMGRRLVALTCDDKALELAGALEYAGHPCMGKPVAEIEKDCCSDVVLTADLPQDCKVLVDFSIPRSTIERAREAADKGIALVIGTTGLSQEEEVLIADAAERVPVIHAPNFSLGVNMLMEVAAQVARSLGDDFNIEIAEAHHNKKADAPSGTAMGLAKAVCQATGRDLQSDLVHGRSGRPGERSSREIGMHALRLGSVVGDHTVFFGSDYERIELTHKAETRDVFAAGALRAAKWLADKAPGMYTMKEVLFG